MRTPFGVVSRSGAIGMSEARLRRAGAVLMLAGLAWFLPWLLLSLNWDLTLVALVFAGGHLVIAANLVLAAVNNWERSHAGERLLTANEPLVGVIIPTAGEPVWMVERTLRSVIEQDYPVERLRVVVSDDAHEPAIARMVAAVASELPAGTVIYHDPEPRAWRRGDGKAGNLNSAMRAVGPKVRYVETRDADDIVVDRRFLRHCLGLLEADPALGYVQTIKTAETSPGDPFNNNEPIFYREVMAAKHAANAVFPCGSGLVWRRAALEEIGGFPVWNLVEDVQSGVEALRRGWRSAYLPIVGAHAQHSPEDLPNFFKQRGTWAVDTVRLVVWGKLAGLTLRQRLHFVEMLFFYVQGFTLWALALIGAAWLALDLAPLVSDPEGYALHFVPFAVGLEVFLVAFKGRQPYLAMWRTREVGVALAPLFLWAFLVAVLRGPNSRPRYRITRKQHAFAMYWREVLPHAVAVAVVAAGFLYGAAVRAQPYALSLVTLYWSALFVVLLSGFIRKAWFGVRAVRTSPAPARAS